MFEKEAFGALSVAVTLISLAPYYWHTWRGYIKPHAFSWIIWFVLMVTGAAAQYAGGAGPGMWATGATGIACGGIALLALFKGERNITRGDWFTFIAALAAIPLWVVTSDPLWSIILITIIDVVGFYPTVRKSWDKPHEELAFTHTTSGIKHTLSLFALQTLSLTTWLYPAALVLANFGLALMLLLRRRQLQATGL